jgi:hypothetical protein
MEVPPRRIKYFLSILALLLITASFFVSIWPLAVAGLVLLLLLRFFILALLLGLCLDLIYGAPSGLPSVLALPFTFLTIAGASGYLFLERFLIEK